MANPLGMITTEELGDVQTVFPTAVDVFMNRERPIANVVGLGMGVKWTKGVPTGIPALLVLVTQKMEKKQLYDNDIISPEFKGVETDVVRIGIPNAGGNQPGTGAQTLAKRVRPAKGGYSVGHYKITAGTIGTCVYDILPGGSVSPPKHGIGTPSKYYILSNNHVLANCNNALIGDPILQPGPSDSGTLPDDKIASLNRFVPITFEPPTPLAQHNNLVDAAVAEGEFADLDREIYWNGSIRGWKLKSKVSVGSAVKKVGRTSNLSSGKVTAIKATVDVSYGGGLVARFKDQFVTTNISAGGDSGSLVTTLDNIAVGLLFAGSTSATIVNPIESVRSLLRVEVAEQIL
jgi:hypothetical protein